MRYLVELTPTESGFDDIQALATRSRAASEALSRNGTPVRFLRAVFVPEDGSCFLLFEAPSAEEARLAATRAELGVERVVEALRIGDDRSGRGVER